MSEETTEGRRQQAVDRGLSDAEAGLRRYGVAASAVPSFSP